MWEEEDIILLINREGISHKKGGAFRGALAKKKKKFLEAPLTIEKAFHNYHSLS
jgi:hypothetical protein